MEVVTDKAPMSAKEISNQFHYPHAFVVRILLEKLQIRMNTLDYIKQMYYPLTIQRTRCIMLSNAWGPSESRVIRNGRFDLFVCILLQLNAHSHCDCHFATAFLWFAIISSFTSWNRRYHSHFGSISLLLVAVDGEQWFFLVIFPIYMRSTLEPSEHPISFERKRKKRWRQSLDWRFYVAIGCRSTQWWNRINVTMRIRLNLNDTRQYTPQTSRWILVLPGYNQFRHLCHLFCVYLCAHAYKWNGAMVRRLCVGSWINLLAVLLAWRYI